SGTHKPVQSHHVWPRYSPVDGSDRANRKFSCCPALAIGIIVSTHRSGKGVQNMSLHIDETIFAGYPVHLADSQSARFSLDAMRSSQLGMTVRYNFVLPDSAADSVNSSADSRPPPAGIPRAMRVSATGLLFKRSTM